MVTRRRTAAIFCALALPAIASTAAAQLDESMFETETHRIDVVFDDSSSDVVDVALPPASGAAGRLVAARLSFERMICATMSIDNDDPFLRPTFRPVLAADVMASMSGMAEPVIMSDTEFPLPLLLLEREDGDAQNFDPTPLDGLDLGTLCVTPDPTLQSNLDMSMLDTSASAPTGTMRIERVLHGGDFQFYYPTRAHQERIEDNLLTLTLVVEYDYEAVDCTADMNRDGAVQPDDFFTFRDALFSRNPAADINADGVVNSRDYFAFLNAYFRDPCGDETSVVRKTRAPGRAMSAKRRR